MPLSLLTDLCLHRATMATTLLRFTATGLALALLLAVPGTHGAVSNTIACEYLTLTFSVVATTLREETMLSGLTYCLNTREWFKPVDFVSFNGTLI